MKLAAVVVIALASLVGAARAGEPGAVELGVGVGGPGAGLGGEFITEAVVRPVDGSPFRVHALWMDGTMDVEDYGSVDYAQYRLGAEAAGCGATGVFCGIADLDAGILRADAADFSGSTYVGTVTRTGFLLGGRVGFDTGNEHLRMRLTFDIASALSGRFTATGPYGDHESFGGAVSLDAELLAAF